MVSDNTVERVKSNENLTEGRSFSQKKTLPGCPPPFFDFDDWAKAAVVGLWIVWAGTRFGAVHTIHSLAWSRLLPDRGPIERQVQRATISLRVLDQGQIDILPDSRNSTR